MTGLRYVYAVCRPLGAPLQDHLEIAVEKLSLRLRIHQQWQIIGGLQAGLDAVDDRDTERI